ncbi:MAG: adenylate/guanylate cyclase domain-containing protein, partial [Pseudomonadota bacterium]
VFLHAAAVDGVASGWAPAPLGRGPTLALLLLAAALPAAAALYRSRLTAAAATAGAMGGGLLAGALLLEWSGLLLASGATLWAPPAAAALAFTLRLGVLERDARSLRRRFEHYLAPVLIERMVAEGEMPRLGGAPCEATVMFADLSGFTALSETVESDRLMSLLNRYLDLMSTIIRDHDGYVDKFIGDAVMAIWNAPAPIPDHARAAVQAALAIEAAVRAQAEADAAAGLPGFHVKIGINSGSVSAGNIGARHRLNYSVVGETVNVAARLESLPGVFATPVILGEGTVRAMGAGAGSEVLRLARIRVKGRAAPLSIYAPLTQEEATWSHARRYAEALAAYEEGRFGLAAAGWDALQGTEWRGAGPARLMACDAHRRAKALAAEREGAPPNGADPEGVSGAGVSGPSESGPGGAWDGVLAFTSK